MDKCFSYRAWPSYCMLNVDRTRGSGELERVTEVHGQDVR